MLKRLLVLIIVVMSVPAVSLLLAGDTTPDGSCLWKYITVESPYTGWEAWREYHESVSQRGHGAGHRVFINTSGRTSEGSSMNNGTVIVKENIRKDKTVSAITVMHKIQGYNPSDGDWFWAKYSSTGTLLRSGKIRGCIGCHRLVKEKDFIFGRGAAE